MKALRGRNRRAPLAVIIDGVWFSMCCSASGFVPARVKHAATCRFNSRPITWSPAVVLGQGYPQFRKRASG